MPDETPMKHRRKVLVVALVALAGCLLAFVLARFLSPRFTMEEYRTISRQVRTLTRKWRRSRPGPRDAHLPYDVCLVVDTRRPAMLLERDGTVMEDEVCKLPQGFTWEIYHITPDGETRLGPVIRLRQRADLSQQNIFQEVFLVHGYKGKAGIHLMISETGGGGGWGRLTDWSHWFEPRGKAGPNTISESMLVTDEKSISPEESIPEGVF